MSQFGELVSLRQFVKSLAKNYDKTGIFHVGGARWIVRCEAGVLLNKDGESYARIEDVLADLAGAGVRRIAVEWDGLAQSTRAASDAAAVVSAH